MDDLEVLEEKACRTVERHRMLDSGDRVVVAVSGGPDSVALLLFLERLSQRLSLDLRVWHLDHMIRGLASALDARFVEGLAARSGLPCAVVAADVPAAMRESGLSPQAVARDIRLGNLMSYADEVGADRVAMGHTADDQVETFLMRIVQGSGLGGLSGMRPASGRVIRPLIEVWRGEVEAYCRALAVEPRRDASNESDTYLRNRVRMRLIPALVSEFGPGVKDVMLREVESLSVDHDFLQGQVELAFDRLAAVRDGEVRIDLEGLKSTGASIERGVIREAWRALLPRATGLAWQSTVDIVEKVAGGATSARMDLAYGASVEREYGKLVFKLAGRPAAAPGADIATLEIPGSTRVGTGPVVTAREVVAAEVVFDDDPSREFIRADAEMPLQVRTPHPGDRFTPLGAPGSRKLSDFFTDIKLPRRLRAACPLVISGGRIAWVAGHRLDAGFAVGRGDAKAIRLRLHACGEYDEGGPDPEP